MNPAVNNDKAVCHMIKDTEMKAGVSSGNPTPKKTNPKKRMMTEMTFVTVPIEVIASSEDMPDVFICAEKSFSFPIATLSPAAAIQNSEINE